MENDQMSDIQQSPERAILDAQLWPKVVDLKAATDIARRANESAEVGKAFGLVAVALAESAVWDGIDESARDAFDAIARSWNVSVDRSEGDSAAAFLEGGLQFMGAFLTEDERVQVRADLDAWAASAPKGRRGKGAGKSKAGRVERSTLCGACGKTLVDTTDKNSARWTLQEHCQSQHGWAVKFGKGQAEWQALTDLMTNGGSVEVAGITFTTDLTELDAPDEVEGDKVEGEEEEVKAS
jgi:hypothetical protein